MKKLVRIHQNSEIRLYTKRWDSDGSTLGKSPRKNKAAKPGYQTLLKKDIPISALADEAGTVRIIAGEFAAKQQRLSPINVWDVNLRAEKSANFPIPDGHTTAFLVLEGKVSVNGERKAREGDLVMFDRSGQSISLEAKGDSKLLVMSGEPIDEPKGNGIEGAGLYQPHATQSNPQPSG